MTVGAPAGSYAGLVLGATVMIWAFGPGLLFLFLREARYRTERLAVSHSYRSAARGSTWRARRVGIQAATAATTPRDAAAARLSAPSGVA